MEMRRNTIKVADDGTGERDGLSNQTKEGVGKKLANEWEDF
jgi:hypothetical protein